MMAWLIGFCVIAEAAREVCFKQAANHTAVLKAMMKPMTWLGVLFWGIERVAWTLVLEHVPLSLHPKKLRAVYKAEQFMS